MRKKFLSFGLEIKEIQEDAGVVEGYAAVFNNIDLGLDIIEPGAFKKTIKESGGKFPILSHHNPYKQIGWNVEAKEDRRGLLVKGEFDIENNDTAREHFSLIKKAKEIGAKSGFSIGYYPIKKEPDDKNPAIRRLKELRLFEWSPVTFPMNPEATATAAKGLINVENDIEFFINDLISRGYTTEEIKTALASQAAMLNESDPDADIQSCIELAKQLSKNLTGE